MVAKNLRMAHKFVCLTDKPVDGIECIPLSTQLKGWWTKLELFKPKQFTGWVLYLDLDVVIRDGLDKGIEGLTPDKLWMRDDFSYSLRNPRKDLDPLTRRMLGGIGVCNSSVMLWNGDSVREVWDRFVPTVMDELHGDQNHICRVLHPLGKIGFLPDSFVGSYKYGKIRGEPLAPVMVFHGNPKMDELPKSDPLRVLWEAA